MCEFTPPPCPIMSLGNVDGEASAGCAENEVHYKKMCCEYTEHLCTAHAFKLSRHHANCTTRDARSTAAEASKQTAGRIVVSDDGASQSAPAKLPADQVLH
jgi:hypothetical protein